MPLTFSLVQNIAFALFSLIAHILCALFGHFFRVRVGFGRTNCAVVCELRLWCDNRLFCFKLCQCVYKDFPSQNGIALCAMALLTFSSALFLARNAAHRINVCRNMRLFSNFANYIYKSSAHFVWFSLVFD